MMLLAPRHCFYGIYFFPTIKLYESMDNLSLSTIKYQLLTQLN